MDNRFVENLIINIASQKIYLQDILEFLVMAIIYIVKSMDNDSCELYRFKSLSLSIFMVSKPSDYLII